MLSRDKLAADYDRLADEVETIVPVFGEATAKEIAGLRRNARIHRKVAATYDNLAKLQQQAQKIKPE